MHIQDKKADLVINTYADDVMRLLLEELNIEYRPYNPAHDPTRQPLPATELWQYEFIKKEWTLGPRVVNATRKRLAVNLENGINHAKKAKADAKLEKKLKKEEPEDDVKSEPTELDVVGNGTAEQKSSTPPDEKLFNGDPSTPLS